MQKASTNERLEAALSLRHLGHGTFPALDKGRKGTDHGFKDASHDPSEIRDRFSLRQNADVAIGTGDGFLVVDVDTHKGGAVPSELEGTAPTARSQRGGLHFYFTVDAPIPSGTDVLGPGVDIKCENGLVIAPPSAGYSWVNGGPPSPLPELPEGLRARLHAGRAQRATETDQEALRAPYDDPDERVAAVREKVAKIRNNERFHGREPWMGVAHAIRGALADDPAGFDIFDDFSERSETRPYSPEDNRHAYETANPPHQNGWDQLVMWAGGPEATEEFSADSAAQMAALAEEMQILNDFNRRDAEQDLRRQPLPWINERFSYLIGENGASGGAVVYDHNTVDLPGLPRRTTGPGRLSVAKLRNDLAPMARVNNKPAITAWLEWAQRRTASAVGFYPDGNTPAGIINEWRGWGVDPKPGGSWELFRQHLRDNVCGVHNGRDSDELLTWLLDWLADLVQHPTHKKGCGVGLWGPSGTGKSRVGEILCSVIGPHARAPSSPVLGKQFNAELSRALLLFMDEQAWGGDPRLVGPAKNLATQASITIERKGLEVVTEPWNGRVLWSANDARAWPMDDAAQRRWLVLEVGSGNRSDAPFFKAMQAELDAGGREGLLYDLLHREITSNLREAPRTSALSEVAAATRTGIEAWFADLIDEGELPLGAEAVGNGRMFVTGKALRRDYHDEQPRHPMSSTAFGKAAARLPGVQKTKHKNVRGFYVDALPAVRHKWSTLSQGNLEPDTWAHTDQWGVSTL